MASAARVLCSFRDFSCREFNSLAYSGGLEMIKHASYLATEVHHVVWLMDIHVIVSLLLFDGVANACF